MKPVNPWLVAVSVMFATFMTLLLRCAAIVVLALSAINAQAPFALEEASISTLQQRMQSGQETARSLTEQYLARIEAVDRRGPTLRSVIEVNPDALTIADRLDAERRNGRTHGPLHADVGTSDHAPVVATFDI